MWQMPVLLAITAIRDPLLIDDPAGLILGLWLAAGMSILPQSPRRTGSASRPPWLPNQS